MPMVPGPDHTKHCRSVRRGAASRSAPIGSGSWRLRARRAYYEIDDGGLASSGTLPRHDKWYNDPQLRFHPFESFFFLIFKRNIPKDAIAFY